MQIFRGFLQVKMFKTQRIDKLNKCVQVHGLYFERLVKWILSVHFKRVYVRIRSDVSRKLLENSSL